MSVESTAYQYQYQTLEDELLLSMTMEYTVIRMAPNMDFDDML